MYSDTSFPKTPWPSHTLKKCVLLYSPRCGRARKLSWFTLYGLLGEKPVFVAKANLDTQLSNFLLYSFTYAVVTSYVIEALKLFSSPYFE